MSNSDQTDNRSIQSNVYIDHLSRVYKNFHCYKKKNTWDLCWLGLPESGYYTSDMKVCFLNQCSRGKIKKKLDIIMNITECTSTISMAIGNIMSTFPPTASLGVGVAVASTAVDTIVKCCRVPRNILTISDRLKHEQTINIFKDAEARMLWLNIAIDVASIGAFTSNQILARSARAGRTLSATARTLCTGISATSLSLSGISILNSLYELKKKGIDNITKFDVLQFTISIFFFAHSVVSFKTATDIIRDIQKDEIERIKKNVLTEHYEKYYAYLKTKKEFLGQDNLCNKEKVIEAQAQFIRELKTTDNINDFFEQFKINQKNQVHVNYEEAINHQVDFSQEFFAEKEIRSQNSKMGGKSDGKNMTKQEKHDNFWWSLMMEIGEKVISELIYDRIKNNVDERDIPVSDNHGENLNKKDEEVLQRQVCKEILEDDNIREYFNSFNDELFLNNNEDQKFDCVTDEKIINGSNEDFQYKNTFFEGYFEIAKQIVESPFSNFALNVSDDEIIGTLFSEEHGTMAIKYDVNPDRVSGTATLYKLAGLDPVVLKTMLFRSDKLR